MKKIAIGLGLFAFGISGGQVTPVGISDYGRMESVTYDVVQPQKLYALSNGGNHIVVSADNGSTWQILYAFPFPSAQLRDLRQLDPDTVSFRVALSETQDGLYLFSLTQLALVRYYPMQSQGYELKLRSYDVFDPQGRHVLLHETYNVGDDVTAEITRVYLTNDYGTSWQVIYDSQQYDDRMLHRAVFGRQTPEDIFLTCGFGPGQVSGGLMASHDAGATWQQKLPGIILDAIAFHPADPNMILVGTGYSAGAHDENLYRSADGGETWQVVPNDWAQSDGLNTINAIAFHPFEPMRIYVLEENQFSFSEDGGQTWHNTTTQPDQSDSYYAGTSVSFDASFPQNLVVTAPYFCQHSTDGGYTLSQLESPFCHVPSVTVSGTPENRRLVYSVQGGVVRQDISGGNPQVLDIESVNSYSVKKNYLFADTEVAGRVYRFASQPFFAGRFYISFDGGQSYAQVAEFFADELQAIGTNPQDGNIFYAAFRSGETSGFYRFDITSPNAVTFIEIPTPGLTEDGTGSGVVTGIKVSVADPSTIYIAQGRHFYVSHDGGNTWASKSDGLEFSEFSIIQSMAGNPANDSEFVVATNDGIFRTVDAGENWTQVFSGGAVRQIRYAEIPHVLVAADRRSSQLYYSVDGGENWTIITQQELGYTLFEDVEFVFGQDSFDAYLSTSDIGVVRFHFDDLPLGIPQTDVPEIRLWPNPVGRTLHVGFADQGAIASLGVFSITGQQLISGHGQSIDVGSLAAGIYILRVNTPHGRTFTKKFIRK